MKTGFFTLIFTFLSLQGLSQTKKIFVCDSLYSPIQFCSLINLSKNQVLFSDILGYIFFEKNTFSSEDTILIKHVSYKEERIIFKKLVNSDTLKLINSITNLKEVVVRNNIDVESLKMQETIGIFERRFDGAYYLGKGQQIGVLFDYARLNNPLLSKVKIHFSELNKNAIFKIGVISIKQDGTLSDNLLNEDIIITPKKLVTTVNLIDKKIFLPDDSVLIYLECINDIGVDKTINKIRTWNSSPNVRTFTNFMNVKPWTEWKYILPKKQYPLNAQIQIQILHKN